MLNKLISLANKAVPAALGIKGLGKIDPRLEKFFSGAAASGYGTDMALDFLRDQLSPSSNDTEMLEKGESQGTLRPDEAASLQTSRQRNELPNAAKNVAVTGASLAGGIGSLGTSALGAASQGRANVEEAPQPGGGENTPQQALEQPQAKSQSPLSRSALTEQAQQMIAPDDVLQAFEQLAQQSGDPVRAAGQMSTLPQYRDIIKQIEKKSGMSFLDWAVNELGKKRQPQQGNSQNQGQNPQGNGGAPPALTEDPLGLR